MMIGQVSWKPSVRASSLHAIHALMRGRTLRDGPLELMLRPIAERFRSIGFSPDVWRHLVPCSANSDEDSELALVVKNRLTLDIESESQFSGTSCAHLAQFIEAAQIALIDLHPNLHEELRVRVRPLREQWEARGPGLLSAIGQLTDSVVGEVRADVILVQPVLGGAGRAFPEYGAVSMEAVLANPFSELPEVVRLGWLIAQNSCASFVDPALDRTRASLVCQLAMLPVSLSAAEAVDLCHLNESTIELALQQWDVELPDGPDVNAILPRWWREQQIRGLDWQTAIKQLEASLE